MAGTFTQIYVQYVFSPNGRQALLLRPWREEVFKYIAGIVNSKGQKSIIVNGVTDHVHIFVGLKPTMRISDLVRDIKNNSSKFINEQKFLNGRFSWQEGYGAFTYSHSQVKNIYQYIANQEEHHKSKTFKEEYLEFLKEHGMEFNEKYLFEWMD